VEAREPHTIGENLTNSAMRLNIMEFLNKLKIHLPRDPAIHIWVYIKRKQNQYVEETSLQQH
jgi:hypothetical protein